MNTVRLNDTPIFGTGEEITLTGTQKTLEEMGVVFSPLAQIVRVRFYEPLDGALLGKYAHDKNATISATDGIPIVGGDPVVLNRNQFKAPFISAGSDVIAYTEQWGIAEVCDFEVGYTNVMAQLMPKGLLWVAKCIIDSDLYKFLSLFGKAFSDYHCFLDRVICEFFASKCKFLCDNWFNELFDNNIKDCFDKHGLSKQDEIFAMIMKVISRGARKVEDYIEIAEIIGLEVTVTDAQPDLIFEFIAPNITFMTACQTACSRLTDGPDMNLILAYACILNIIAPAHSNVIFKIDGCEFEVT